MDKIQAEADKRNEARAQIDKAIRTGDIDAAVKAAKRLARLFGNKSKSAVGAAAIVLLVDGVENVVGRKR